MKITMNMIAVIDRLGKNSETEKRCGTVSCTPYANTRTVKNSNSMIIGVPWLDNYL